MGLTHPESEELFLSELMSFLETNLHWYSHIEISLCLERQNGEFKIAAGKIYFVPVVDEGPPDESLEYERIILSRYHIPIKKYRDFINSIFEGNHIIHPEFGEIPLQFKIDLVSNRPHLYNHRHESGRQWAQVNCIWPYFLVQLDLQDKSYPDQYALVHKDLPIFPSWYAGAFYFLRIGFNESDPHSMRYLPIIIPDPRARIDGITIEEDSVHIEFILGISQPSEVVVKILTAMEDRFNTDTIILDTIPNDATVLSYQMQFEADRIIVHLVSSISNDDLDFRDISLRWGSAPPGVVIQRSEESLLQFLEQGESTHVEFKETLNSKNANEKIAKVISSFANTAGGILFLGINDDGRPVNSIEETEKDRVSQIVLERIEPMVDMEYRFLKMENYSIMAILVAEGEEKPYFVRDHGVFIRYNATTKHVTRSELLNMVISDKQSQNIQTRFY